MKHTIVWEAGLHSQCQCAPDTCMLIDVSLLREQLTKEVVWLNECSCLHPA
eukprot:m.8454 g.8454  ORF g.8454 m.8454 type:complete len:51 (+) comp5808_c0_seq1:160-312(+)